MMTQGPRNLLRRQQLNGDEMTRISSLLIIPSDRVIELFNGETGDFFGQHCGDSMQTPEQAKDAYMESSSLPTSEEESVLLRNWIDTYHDLAHQDTFFTVFGFAQTFEDEVYIVQKIVALLRGIS